MNRTVGHIDFADPLEEDLEQCRKAGFSDDEAHQLVTVVSATRWTLDEALRLLAASAAQGGAVIAEIAEALNRQPEIVNELRQAPESAGGHVDPIRAAALGPPAALDA